MLKVLNGKDKLRVVLSFIFYPMSIGRFFENALRCRDDIELVTIGPYSGSWIPWNGGMNVSQKYAKLPDIPLPFQKNGPILLPSVDYIENLIPWKPDLWLQVDAGFHFKGKPSKGKSFIVATDPHVLNYDYQRSISDKFFCMQTPYIKQASNDIYLPYAYDPTIHFPEKQPHNYDVCLLGLHYPERDQIVSGLRDRGIKTHYDLGPMFDEYRNLHNQAPIGVNWSSKQDLTARVFELLAMRRLVVTNDVPDLSNFFRAGRDLVAAQSVDEAIEAVVYYLSDDKLRHSTAQNGWKTVQEHTWDNRISQILSLVS